MFVIQNWQQLGRSFPPFPFYLTYQLIKSINRGSPVFHMWGPLSKCQDSLWPATTLSMPPYLYFQTQLLVIVIVLWTDHHHSYIGLYSYYTHLKYLPSPWLAVNFCSSIRAIRTVESFLGRPSLLIVMECSDGVGARTQCPALFCTVMSSVYHSCPDPLNDDCHTKLAGSFLLGNDGFLTWWGS